ncbi:hypothetical protein [Clostridium coskatii]|uniref:Uncharacterized protein n=1 Tax=Clostridium coskatii TaxID=1705578 RepID=A0A166T165_9CLOT|nr:hypothetical protein [Clostridium coskatii]OAA93044.1 hypothetical protein WX73_00362 [Clostridium coskatii]OBR90787.1 hypothetical protein CLCOS_37620 [Clostridium coskatii]
MPDTEDIARDLTVIYLQNNFNKNLSPEDLVKKYKEVYKKFENASKEPIQNVQILDL